jgi:ATP-dependent protease ClpP protease subunit
MTIEMFGEIVSDDWAWLYEFFQIPHCCPGQVRDAIRSLPEGEDLILEINSPGGDVWAGFEIYGLLQACRASTEAHVIAMAASAATTVMCGCDLALASPVAQIMIHQPAAFVEDYLNNDATRQLQNYLDSVKASILNGYVLKCAGKATRRKLEQLVDASTWMPVQDALELGLIDGYLDLSEDASAALPMGSGIRVANAAGVSPAPRELLARYESAVRAGTAEALPGHPVYGEPSTSSDPAQLSDDWRLRARIDLERVRA